MRLDKGDRTAQRVLGRFRWVTGDVDFLKYGGTFVWVPHNPLVSGPENIYHFLTLTNAIDALGEREVANACLPTYMARLCIVHLDDIPGAQLRDALTSCDDGLLAEIQDLIQSRSPRSYVLTEELYLRMALACESYGAYAPVWDESGNNWQQLVRAAKAASMEAWQDSTRSYLDKVVNQIGTTARDYMRGDVYAGLAGKIQEGDAQAALIGKILLRCEGQTLGGKLEDSLLTGLSAALATLTDTTQEPTDG